MGLAPRWEFPLRIFAITWLFLVWESYAFVMWTPSILETSGQIKGRDFAQFYTMGALVREGRADLLQDGPAMTAWLGAHVPEAAGFRLQNVYAPHVAAGFAVLAGRSYGQALGAWVVISFFVYAAGCALIIRRTPALGRHSATVAVLAAGSPALLLTVVYGHLSALALFCAAVCYAALRIDRRFLAGIAVGALAYKPQLGLVLGAVFCLSRDWRALIGIASAVVAQAAVSLMVAPAHVSIAYVEKLAFLVRDPSPIQSRNLALNQSLAGFFNLLTGNGPGSRLAYVAGASLALLLAFLVWRSKARLEVRFSAVLLATVLVSPHFFVYDLVLLMAPALLLLAEGVRVGGRRGVALGGVAALLYVLAPLVLFFPLEWRLAPAPIVLSAGLAYVTVCALRHDLPSSQEAVRGATP